MPRGGTNQKVNQDTPSSNKPQDKWEEGLNKDGDSDEGSQKEKDDILPHEDLPLDADEEEEHAQATPCLAPIVDECYYRETDFYWADWDDLIFKFEKDRGVEEGECYDSFEGKYNVIVKQWVHAEMILQFKYHSGGEGKECDIVGVREEFRSYGRPPFFA